MGGGNFQNTPISLSYHLVSKPLVGNGPTLGFYPMLKVHLKIGNFECNLIRMKLMALCSQPCTCMSSQMGERS